MNQLSYDALLPAVFFHISQNIEIPVLVDFIKTEFGIDHFEYIGDSIFEMDEKAYKIFLEVKEDNVDYLYKSIESGWNEVKKKQRA